MNIAKLVLRASHAELTHIGSSSTRISRTADELRGNISDLSESLLELGLRPRDSLLVVGGGRVEIAESILAALNVGVVVVPLSPLLGPTYLNGIIARMRPKCCIIEDLPEGSLQHALSQFGTITIAIKATAESAALGYRPYRDLVGRHQARAVFREHAAQDPALILHGSGSSGALKTIVMSHERLLTFLEYNRLVFAQYSDGQDPFTSNSAMVSSLPLTHLAGLGNTLTSLINGQRTFILSSFVPETYLKLIEETRCAHILLVPSLYRSLLKEPYLKRMDRSALRFCIIGGEPCSLEVLGELAQAFGVPFVTAYGMTECLSGIAHVRRDLYSGRIKPAGCGKQLFGEISLRDPEGHEHSDSGELWVRNATVAQCYLETGLNEQRFSNGWFRTGDLFFRDSDGVFFHRGRVDDMFICNGKNIYPLEIEQLLGTHPAVDMVCAGPVSLKGMGSVPAVMVVAKCPVGESELQEFCMRLGPSHAVPQFIHFVDALPLLGPGKVDRREALRLLQAHFLGGKPN